MPVWNIVDRTTEKTCHRELSLVIIYVSLQDDKGLKYKVLFLKIS
jgi:hypothetical protein